MNEAELREWAKTQEWQDKNSESHCYCVVCLAHVRKDIFELLGGTCPYHQFDEPIQYGLSGDGT